jgi:uncharacterized phage infection (PIP) family protein YhgE
MKTNVTSKQQLSFNDVQVTITGKDFIGELHMSLADAADLAIGAELEISKPGIGSKTSSWLGNLFGTSDEALKAKIIDLQTALDKSNGKVSVLEATVNQQINIGKSLQDSLTVAQNDLSAANERVNQLTEQLSTTHAGQ